MKLHPFSSAPMRWVFAACLASILTLPFQAQDTPPKQDTPPTAPQTAQTQDPQTQGAQAQDAQEEVEVNGNTRTFLVHLPQGYDSQQHYPVVILLHGLDQEASEMARLTHFNEFADRDSIIAVYPNSLHGRWNLGGGQPREYRRDPYRRPGIYGGGYPPGPRPQDGERREGGRTPDIQFFNRMLDKLAIHYSVDTRRIYATGLGDGGFMTLRIGCSMADRVAAIAPVDAAMPRMLNCVPSRPIPAIFMNGTDDPIVPYDGGRYKDGNLHLFSAEDTAKEWARLNHCSEKPSESKLPAPKEGGKDTKVYIFEGCQEGAQVALYTVKNGGHTWPGGEQYRSEKEVGKTSDALNANETIWGFLVTKKISGESGVEK
jgi:polyhydroxybutyrate depolymerase